MALVGFVESSPCLLGGSWDLVTKVIRFISALVGAIGNSRYIDNLSYSVPWSFKYAIHRILPDSGSAGLA